MKLIEINGAINCVQSHSFLKSNHGAIQADASAKEPTTLSVHSSQAGMRAAKEEAKQSRRAHKNDAKYHVGDTIALTPLGPQSAKEMELETVGIPVPTVSSSVFLSETTLPIAPKQLNQGAEYLARHGEKIKQRSRGAYAEAASSQHGNSNCEIHKVRAQKVPRQ